MRAVKGIEEIVQRTSDFEPKKIEMKASDKVVAVLIKNQGTATVLTGLNSVKAYNKTFPGASMPYGIDNAVMEGFIMIDFEAAGNGECVVITYRDLGEACE